MDWDDFKYFTAVAHSGSVRKAAVLLGVHASTVTRRLDQFERHLGVRLFTRTRSGLVITPEGSEVIQQVDEVAAELGAIQRRLQYRHADMAGPVRITIAEVFVENLLSHDFAEFSARHPELRLEFIPSHQHPDLDKHEVEISVCVTDDPPDHLIGRRLGKLSATVYCSHRYLSDRDPWVNPEDCRWIETDSGMDATPGPAADEDMSVVTQVGLTPQASLKSRYFATMPDGARVHGLMLQLVAIRGDMGIGSLPCVLGDSDPELVRLPGVDAFATQHVWMFIHPDLRNLVRVQALMEFLQQTFRDHPGRVLGET